MPSRWRGGCSVKGSASKVPVARGPVFYPELPAPTLDRFRGDLNIMNAFICDCQRQYWYNYSVKTSYTSVPQYIRPSRAVLFCLISCRYWRAHGGGWRRAEALGSVRWVASVDCPCFASTASDRRKVVASGPFPPPTSVQLLDGILALDLRHRPCRFAVEVDPHRPARQSHEVAAGSGVYADGRSRHIFRRSGNRSRLVEIETDYRASSRCQAGVCDMGSLHRRHVKSGLTLAREPLRNSRHGWAGKRQMRADNSSARVKRRSGPRRPDGANGRN